MPFSILYSCNNKSGNAHKTEKHHDENPATDGFNAEASDQKAIEVMQSALIQSRLGVICGHAPNRKSQSPLERMD